MARFEICLLVNYEGSFGRQGDGPGEFQFPRAIWQRADGSLVVFDARHWRLTVIRDTQLVSTHAIRPPGANPPDAVARLDDGSVIVHETLFAIPESGFEAMPEVIRWITLDEQPPDTILETEGGRMGPIEFSGGSMVSSPLFESDFVASAAGDAIYASDCDDPQFREFSSEGELRRIVRWRTGDRTLTRYVARVRRWAPDLHDTISGKDLPGSPRDRPLRRPSAR